MTYTVKEKPHVSNYRPRLMYTMNKIYTSELADSFSGSAGLLHAGSDREFHVAEGQKKGCLQFADETAFPIIQADIIDSRSGLSTQDRSQNWTPQPVVVPVSENCFAITNH